MEHSLFPRKRTLLGRTRGHHNERNAIRNKLLAAQAKEAKNGPHGHHHQYGEQRQTHRRGEIASGSTNNPDMIHVAGDEDRNNMEANDVSTGVSVSRTSRSCFNSTAGPTGTTTVPPSANVSIAQPETIDEKSQNIRVINGNLAPPSSSQRFNRTSSPPQTPTS